MSLLQLWSYSPDSLDLILTNLDKFYQPPVKRPPFGLSDHFTILLPFPKFITNTRETKQLSAALLLNLNARSLIPFRHVMKNGLPLNQSFELGWTSPFHKNYHRTKNQICNTFATRCESAIAVNATTLL